MIIVFNNDSSYFNYMVNYQDFIYVKEIDNCFLRRLCRIHMSVKFNKYFRLPFKFIWYKYFLEYSKINRDEKNYFFFFEGNQLAYDKNYINYLKKKYPNSKFVFRYTNIIYEGNKWATQLIDKVYDLVVSMDKDICREKNWFYYPNTYNLKIIDDCSNCNNEYDIFFIGKDKGRIKLLQKIYRYLSAHGIKCLFMITSGNYGQESKIEGIKYINYMDYCDVLNYVKKSKCILEILQDGQKGSSLRPFEAIAYNKKLITNNSSINDEIFFDKKNMKSFNYVEEIDIDFILDNEPVEYTNKEIISSDYFFEKIIGSI